MKIDNFCIEFSETAKFELRTEFFKVVYGMSEDVAETRAMTIAIHPIVAVNSKN